MESCNRKGLAMRKWLLGRITDALTLEGGMPVVRVKTTERICTTNSQDNPLRMQPSMMRFLKEGCVMSSDFNMLYKGRVVHSNFNITYFNTNSTET